LYVPAARPVIVLVAVDPVIAPGLMVHVPAGKPLRTTLPVASAQVGCVIVPTTGAVGDEGAAVITALPDATDVQPEALVTVKVYVLAASPLNEPVRPVPVIVAPPGDLVTVHVPVAGNPLRATLPVAIAHVGCVIVPTTGAEGDAGTALMTTLADAVEIHPAALEMV